MRRSIQTLRIALATLLMTSIATAQNDANQTAQNQAPQDFANRAQVDQFENMPQPEADPDINQGSTSQAVQGSNQNQTGRRQSNPQGQSNQQWQGNQPWQARQGQYSGAARGTMSYPNQVFVLRYDHAGREFICVHGQRIYFNGRSAMGQPTMDGGQRYQSGYGDMDQDMTPPAPPQAPNSNPSQQANQNQTSDQNQSSQSSDSQADQKQDSQTGNRQTQGNDSQQRSSQSQGSEKQQNVDQSDGSPSDLDSPSLPNPEGSEEA